jgi:hypothetical protein
MKTHPITDHVPEAELTAITPEGAARWLKQRGWRDVPTGDAAPCATIYAGPDYRACDNDAPVVLFPASNLFFYAKEVAHVVSYLGRHTKIPPRTIIAEMQADSRIVAELQRMSAKKAAAPTNRESGKVEP